MAAYIGSVLKGLYGGEGVDDHAEDGDEGGEEAEGAADDEKGVCPRPDPDGRCIRRRPVGGLAGLVVSRHRIYGAGRLFL